MNGSVWLRELDRVERGGCFRVNEVRSDSW